MSFTLSENAIKRLKYLKEKEGMPFFRVRVDTGGCAGFQYIFLFDDVQTPDDHLIQQEDVAVLIDTLSLSFLENAQLEYQEEMMGSSFVINNPNAASSCGCKNSFTPV